MPDTDAGNPRRRSSVVLKIAVAFAAMAVLVYLIVRSAGETRAEPYTMPRAHLEGWALALDPGTDPADPLLVLRPRPELVPGLFRQVFQRAMESMSMSARAGIPLLLKGEYDRAFAGHVSSEALLSAAEAAGLPATPLEPRCLGHRRFSEPGSVRQLYFALFDAPAVLRFREDLVTLLPGGAAPPGAFNPAAQSAMLVVSTAGPAFAGWLPMQVDPEADCVAPIVLER